MNKITITLIALLLIPIVFSLNEDDYLSCGGWNELEIDCFSNAELSFLGKLAVAPSVAEVPISVGAERTDCHTLADQFKTCYFVNEDIQCEEGCPENYFCDKNYRCEPGKLVVEKEVTTILETANENKKLLITLGLVGAIIGLGIIAEEEFRKKNKLKKELKENQKKLPKVEKSKKE